MTCSADFGAAVTSGVRADPRKRLLRSFCPALASFSPAESRASSVLCFATPLTALLLTPPTTSPTTSGCGADRPGCGADRPGCGADRPLRRANLIRFIPAPAAGPASGTEHRPAELLGRSSVACPSPLPDELETMIGYDQLTLS